MSCAAKKGPGRAPARDLYISPLFRKARGYAECRGAPWFILSARYGLVCPDTVIEPYELTLNTMPKSERRRWACRVLTQLTPHLKDVEAVVFLAGRRYREFLRPPLESRGLDVCIPMEGMRIGEQLRWLSRKSCG